MIYADFRSDTVTRPTPAMREAMAKAPVGDDVYGDDPTVNLLEAKAAEMLGKEAAIFVSSGTMGNLIAVLASCQRGDEAIMGRQGHTFLHEAGGVSVLGGVVINTIPNQHEGRLALADLESAIRYPDIHEPISRLIILENAQIPVAVLSCRLSIVSRSQLLRVREICFCAWMEPYFNATVALGDQ